MITVSREFSSGGRELGKCLADDLGFDYYDRESIMALAQFKGLNEEYVESVLDNHAWSTVLLSFRHSFPAIPTFGQIGLCAVYFVMLTKRHNRRHPYPIEKVC